MVNYISNAFNYAPNLSSVGDVLEGADLSVEWALLAAPAWTSIGSAIQDKIQFIEAGTSPLRLKRKVVGFNKTLSQYEALTSRIALEIIQKAASCIKGVASAIKGTDRYVTPILTPAASFLLSRITSVFGVVGNLASLIMNGQDVYENSNTAVTGEKPLIVALARLLTDIYSLGLILFVIVEILLEITIAPVFILIVLTMIFLTELFADFYSKI